MTPAEAGYLGLLIDFALTEDLSDDGDVTSRATIPEGLKGRAAFVARAPGVLAGHRGGRARLPARRSQLQFAALRQDGYRVAAKRDGSPPSRGRCGRS